MNERHHIEKQGLDRYAVDLSNVRISQAQYRHRSGWQGAYLWNLKHGDEESAHLIRVRNDDRYAEECERQAAEVFPMVHAPLRSLSEVASEIEEMRYA